MNKTLKQIFSEFWIPFVAAVFWAIYDYRESISSVDKNAADLVKTFGAAFFFVSWLLAQWFRVRKQQKVDTDLSNLDAQVKATLTRLDATAEHLIGHITGGDAVCFVQVSNMETPSGRRLILSSSSNYPVYDIRARVFDWDNFQKSSDRNIAALMAAESHFEVELLLPETVQVVKYDLSLEPANSRSLNIFFSARNGLFTQLLRCKKVGDNWFYATKVTRKEQCVYESTDDGYPKNEAGEVDW